jgi:hypothetical protein
MEHCEFLNFIEAVVLKVTDNKSTIEHDIAALWTLKSIIFWKKNTDGVFL